MTVTWVEDMIAVGFLLVHWRRDTDQEMPELLEPSYLYCSETFSLWSWQKLASGFIKLLTALGTSLTAFACE